MIPIEKSKHQDHDRKRSEYEIEAIYLTKGIGYSSDKSLARFFDVSRSTIWLWTRTGRLPQPHKLSSGSTRWCNAEINTYLSKGAKS